VVEEELLLLLLLLLLPLLLLLLATDMGSILLAIGMTDSKRLRPIMRRDPTQQQAGTLRRRSSQPEPQNNTQRRISLRS